MNLIESVNTIGFGLSWTFNLQAEFKPGVVHVRPCNLHIINTLELVEEMIRLADRGDADREDNGCGILYGVLRDSAYKLKNLAEEERQNHIRKGWWQDVEMKLEKGEVNMPEKL